MSYLSNSIATLALCLSGCYGAVLFISLSTFHSARYKATFFFLSDTHAPLVKWTLFNLHTATHINTYRYKILYKLIHSWVETPLVYGKAGLVCLKW